MEDSTRVRGWRVGVSGRLSSIAAAGAAPGQGRRPFPAIPLVLLLLLACAGPPGAGEREAAVEGPDSVAAGVAPDTARPGDAPRSDDAPRVDPEPDLLPPDSLLLVFSRDEEPVLVSRPADGAPDLASALELLLRGPLPEERARGLHSWFSAETAGALRSATVDATGHATVDFRDLRPLIPNASTSAGSAMLLQQLDGTVLRVPGVRSVEYRMEGSCEAFWEWLQRSCEVVRRPG